MSSAELFKPLTALVLLLLAAHLAGRRFATFTTLMLTAVINSPPAHWRLEPVIARGTLARIDDLPPTPDRQEQPVNAAV